MQNAEMEQILALMNQYAAVLITLNERGVIRTYNSPVGDFAEWLVSQKLGLRLEKNSARGLDATGSDGLRYQIKCRWERTDFPTPQSRELGVIRSLEKNQFDFLIAVIFDSHFQVRAAYQIPHEIIPRYAVYRRHVNGHSVKGNRQGFLSRFIRAQTKPLHRLCVPLGTKKKKTPFRYS